MKEFGGLLGSILLLVALFWLPILLLRMNGRLRDIHGELVRLNERLEAPRRRRETRAREEDHEVRVSRLTGAFPGIDSHP